jgi:hypothetical protein
VARKADGASFDTVIWAAGGGFGGSEGGDQRRLAREVASESAQGRTGVAGEACLILS